MEQIINLKGEDIRYNIKKSHRARRIRLTIRPNCQLTVTIPRRANLELVEKFMKDKARWIIEKLEFFRKNAVPLIGEQGGKYRQHKKMAEKFVQERLGYYNRLYGFAYGQISVKNHKRRWGSCSSKGNLNFNYRIIFLPPDLADYIIVHEMCHLKEMNHSKSFWRLIEKIFPDHQEKRKALKKIIY